MLKFYIFLSGLNIVLSTILTNQGRFLLAALCFLAAIYFYKNRKS